MQNIKAVILAGGKGTRLESISNGLPKPLVPIHSEPILIHQLNVLRRYDLRDVTIVIHHMGDAIRRRIGDGDDMGLRITYYEEVVPLGTTGALYDMQTSLAPDTLVLYGDVMFDMDLARFIRFHQQSGADITLCAHPNNHPQDSDLLALSKNGRVLKVYPKPHAPEEWLPNMVNAGIYMAKKTAIEKFPKGKADFGREVLPALAGELNVNAYVTAEYIKDVGTPERVKEAEADLLSGRIMRLNRQNPRPAVFLDRDGVINEEVGHLYNIADFRLLPEAGQAIKLLNGSDYLSVVATNQPVIARGQLTETGLADIFAKMETLLGREGAKLDAVYYCPHHPDKGFPGENQAYKIDCECRKPKTGMIRTAAKDWNIDLKRSWFVGDSDRDIECGRGAGLRTIAIKSPRIKERRADFECSDLLQAVNLILAGDRWT